LRSAFSKSRRTSKPQMETCRQSAMRPTSIRMVSSCRRRWGRGNRTSPG
jgi:hypothetical protein